jgi:hypothetical protein
MPDVSPKNIIDNQPTLFEEPYRRHLQEFQALAPEELTPVNLDIATVVTTVLGSLPEILALAPEISRELPYFDLNRVRSLESYAMALSHANTLYLLANQPPDALQPLVDEGTKLRELLLTDATALIQRGRLNGNRLKDLKGPIGHRNLATDLQILTMLFRESFAEVEGKCATTRDELNRAELVAAGILRAVGLKEQGTALIASTSDIRARALTLLLRVYDSARRVVAYLRWNENDADSIAPSLYAGRTGTRKKASSDAAEAGKVPTGSPTAPPVPNPQAPLGTAAGSQSAGGMPVAARDPFAS